MMTIEKYKKDQLVEAIRDTNASYIMPFYTDKKLGIWPLDKFDVDAIDINHLLEVRVFNKESETRIWRNSISEDFKVRTLDESDPRDTIEETQFLDIDTTKTRQDADQYGTIEVVSTGGGKYRLPAELYDDDAKLKIKNYIQYTDEGIAKIVDYRVVEIVKGGK